MEYINKMAKDAQNSLGSVLGSPKLTLYYFDIQGPVEPARLALTIGGIAFEDKRVTFDEMKAMRAAGELKGGGQLPQLHIGGAILSQSQAMGVYCAKLAGGGLYPSDPLAAARGDEVIQFVNEDGRGRCIYPTMDYNGAHLPDKKAQLRKELAEEKLPEKFKLLEAMMDSTYCCGDSLTLADLYVYGLLNWIGMGTLDGVSPNIIREHTKLTKLVATLDGHPQIKEWNASKNPKLPWL